MSTAVRRLRKWCPRMNASGTAFFVDGFLDGEGDTIWQSGVITERTTDRELVTESGARYVLNGPVDVGVWKMRCYPPTYLDEFLNGFPRHWKDLLAEICDFVRTQLLKQDEILAPYQGCAGEFAPAHAKKQRSGKANDSFRSTFDSIVTTRSGRVSKPRLAGWAGQHYLYDSHGEMRQLVNPSVTVANSTQKIHTNVSTLCDALGVSTPAAPVKVGSRRSAVRDANVSKTKAKPKVSDVVIYDVLDDEVDPDATDDADGENDEFDDSEEDTPILPSRQTMQRQARLLRFLDTPADTVRRPKKSKIDKQRRTHPVDRNLEVEELENGAVVEYPESEGDVTMLDRGDPPQAPASAKPKWTTKEKALLIKALRVLNPRTEAGWKSVALTVDSSVRPLDEYVDAARELGWRPTEPNNQQNPGNSTANVTQQSRITAKPGTAAYMIQTDRFMRQHVQNVSRRPPPVSMLNTLAEASTADDEGLAIDESFLDAMLTPEHAARRPRMPYCPPEYSADDRSRADVSNTFAGLSNTSISPSVVEMDDRTREQQIRFAHEVFRNQRRRGAPAATTTTSKSTRASERKGDAFNDLTNDFFRPPVGRPRRKGRDSLLPEERSYENLDNSASASSSSLRF